MLVSLEVPPQLMHKLLHKHSSLEDSIKQTEREIAKLSESISTQFTDEEIRQKEIAGNITLKSKQNSFTLQRGAVLLQIS